MSPLLKSVEEAGIEGVKRKRIPTNTTPADFFAETEILRKKYAQLINADDPKRIVVIPSVSYGISTVAKNVKLKKGQKVLVLSEQFPSNYYPWKRLCDEQEGVLEIIDAPKSANRGEAWNE
jgi:selenocysteine lyase/cysteine desulfurase